MKKHHFLTILCLCAASIGTLSAKTPDGLTPSEETVCDNEQGAAFGLCNAYCEAMDCDSPNHHASDTACAHVKRNFERKTGRPLPCDVTCPCAGLLPLYSAIISGAASVEQCFRDESLVVAVTDIEGGQFTSVLAGVPPTCSDRIEPPFVDLTPTEHLVCRVELCAACEAQGVPCVQPE